MSTAAGGLASATEGRLIFALGGDTSGETKALNTMQAYNPKTNRRHALDPMSTARAMPGAASVAAQIYAIGGFTTAGDALSTVQSSTGHGPLAHRWHQGDVAAATADGRIDAIATQDATPVPAIDSTPV
jgi:hypothetical protein